MEFNTVECELIDFEMLNQGTTCTVDERPQESV